MFIQKMLDLWVVIAIIKQKETLVIAYEGGRRGGVVLCPPALIMYFCGIGFGQTLSLIMGKFSWRKKIPFHGELIEPSFRPRLS
jgi:hypothetical protein